MRIGIAIMAMAACVLPMAAAQTLVADRLTQSQLIEQAQQLSAKAQGPSGAASATPTAGGTRAGMAGGRARSP